MVAKPSQNQLIVFADIAVTFLEKQGLLKEFAESNDLAESAVVFCVANYCASDDRDESFQDEWEAAVRESAEQIKSLKEMLEDDNV